MHTPQQQQRREAPARRRIDPDVGLGGLLATARAPTKLDGALSSPHSSSATPHMSLSLLMMLSASASRWSRSMALTFNRTATPRGPQALWFHNGRPWIPRRCGAGVPISGVLAGDTIRPDLIAQDHQRQAGKVADELLPASGDGAAGAAPKFRLPEEDNAAHACVVRPDDDSPGPYVPGHRPLAPRRAQYKLRDCMRRSQSRWRDPRGLCDSGHRRGPRPELEVDCRQLSVCGLMTPSLSAADLKGTAVESRTADFKFDALAKNSERYFEKCTRRDPQFQEAEALFTEQTSLRRPGVAVAANYAAVTYDTLSVRTRHYCTWERRMRSFNSYRARERAVARVARDIIGPRDTGVHRVVPFRKAEFGSGSRGPIQRKRLIRHLACLAAMVLTDEYRTSITCPQDRAPLHRLALGSRVFRCANATPGVPVEVRCNVGAINCDHAGADNILMCGAAMLL
ncbi:hypothetical protein JKP88DRAFT_248816 [Tribonema minus]|uniref:Uncharacterized protein n=1 Tax=Tribonema minus TaxID=303371 RepID=A0A835YQ26_9STRA|nr:hypothetical protein JKP88DRAFT_248816 [Tribonema minus]